MNGIFFKKYNIVHSRGLAHGGNDPGAISNDIIEKNYNLKISNYIADRFNELDIPYAMTRTKDETLTNDERIKRMQEPFGDVSDVIVLSNHINAGGGEGTEVITALRNNPDLARTILSEIEKTGQKVRTYYQKTLPTDPTKDFYYIMRNTDNLQTIIIEYGFLDNPKDAAKLKKNWEKYAEAVVKAVAEYMGVPYIEPISNKIFYKVASGDSLWSIAKKFNTTVNQIKAANDLKNNMLSIGQELLIPTSAANTVPYKVVLGDTLWVISKKFNTTVDQIKAINNLTTDKLTVGEILKIPKL